MEAGTKAPEFSLPDQNGDLISLTQFPGKKVILFFYPRASTPGCNVEACDFRDHYERMQKAGVVLLGISPDTSSAQKKFADKFTLPFPLLADKEREIAKAFEVIVQKNMYGKKVTGVARTTFIIGEDGKIEHIFDKVKPEGHATQVLDYLQNGAEKS